VPLLLKKDDNKSTMTGLPWAELQKLIRATNEA